MLHPRSQAYPNQRWSKVPFCPHVSRNTEDSISCSSEVQAITAALP